MMHVQADSILNPRVKVVEFITPQRQWNLTKLHQVISDHCIIQRLRGIDIPTSNIEDSLCWGLEKLHEFTTKLATWLAYNSQPLQDPKWEHNWIWRIDTMSKIQIFLWQVMHQALPIRGTLLRRGIPLNSSFLICLDDVESIDHLFIHFPIVKKVSQLAIQHGRLPHGFTWPNFQDLHNKLDFFKSCTLRWLLAQDFISFVEYLEKKK